jgi:hypothetical protein
MSKVVVPRFLFMIFWLATTYQDAHE